MILLLKLYIVVENFPFFKSQYWAGAGAEIMDKSGAKREPEPKINNFGSATLFYCNSKIIISFRHFAKQKKEDT